MKRWRGIVLVLLVLSVPAWAWGQGTTAVPKTDVTVTNAATLVLAGNAFRYALNCTNNSATVHVRWGDATITATTGQRFPNGTAIQILSRGPIYMISEGANVTVSCTEEGK